MRMAGGGAEDDDVVLGELEYAQEALHVPTTAQVGEGRATSLPMTRAEPCVRYTGVMAPAWPLR